MRHPVSRWILVPSYSHLLDQELPYLTFSPRDAPSMDGYGSFPRFTSWVTFHLPVFLLVNETKRFSGQ